MNRVLIITSYFPPETGAAANRIFHLAEGLKSNGHDVSIVTPLPNYPTGEIFKAYKGKFRSTTDENNIKIHRLWLFASNSKNKVVRLFAMLSYSLSLLWFFITHKIPKRVIVQSPPLLVAFTCMLFLKKNRKLILNVSDLWPIAGLELGAFKQNYSYRVLERIERFNYNKATLVMGQSEEILAHVSKMIPDKQTLLYRNYPDFEPPQLRERDPSSQKVKMVYAGLLGVAQGILKLCQNLDCNSIEFHIYGDGAEANKIKDFLRSNPDLSITYHGEVSRNELHGLLLTYDLTIIPLLKRIYGSVPSKIFEFCRLGLPVLYFGGGEGEQIIIDNNLGWVAQSSNYDDLNSVLNKIRSKDLSLELREKIQETAIEKFNFDEQINQLIQILNTTGQ